MIRVFVRFYLGLIVTAVVAMVAVSVVILKGTEEHEERVAEDALRGGAELASRMVLARAPAERPAVLAELARAFGYPVRSLPRHDLELSSEARRELEGPRRIALYRSRTDDTYFLAYPLGAEQNVLSLGPLPEDAVPSATLLLLSLSLIMAAFALMLGLLFVPLKREMAALERSAERYARGDFSVRVEGRASLPLAHAFNRMAEETGRLVDGQRELIHTVSHELRTPLARLRFALELLVSAASEEDCRRYEAALDADVLALEQLVDELLAFARLDARLPGLERESRSLALLLTATIAECGSDRGDVHVELASGCEDMTVCVDVRTFHRALRNLLANACKHARSNVRVALTSGKRFVCVAVEDDGPGVAEADRERVFAPFVRLAADEGQPGTGLGLAIVRRIVEWHGGRVWIETSRLGGARFCSEWPVA